MEAAALNEAISAIERVRPQLTQEEYSKVRNEREKATFSMMMKMNPEALTNIRKEFFARRDAITLDEFIYIIQKHLINKKGDSSFVMETPEHREFGTNMYELFKDIDVNGDGQLEWQEFTSFTVEKANLLNKRAKLASIAHYHDSSDMLDPSASVRHRHDISRFVNIPELGQFAVVEDHRNSIFVFNSRLGRLITTVPTESAPIAISTIAERDKVSLVTSGADMTLSTYSLDDPNPKRRYTVQSSWATPGVQMALAYAPVSRLLYSGATNSNIYSWNVSERNLVSTLTGHTDIVMSLIILKKLNNIASASLDKTIAVWDSHTNEQILKLSGHKKGVFDLTYNSTYRLLFSCGFEHDACVWSPFVNSMVFRLKGHHASLVGVQTVDNSPEVITADTSGIMKLWDVRNFQCIQTFSANLSGQETKDNSKLNCFFHSKLPSRNALQKEDDSRVYAASKMLFSFDQARVVHEATTDYTNVFWVSWNEESPVIITASERNVIVWDALIGSKTFTHTDICENEISACCLDDRKRKLLIGDVTGHIGVHNLSNGALMKTVLFEEGNRSIVVSLVYFDEAKRFIAGYANGDMCLYDENVLEECHLIRKFEAHSQHAELLDLRFNYRNRTAATAGGSSGIAKLWDYDSGKCENELVVCDSHGYIVHLTLLHPYPIVVTSDSTGNIVLWGARGLKWQGLRISGFANGTPVSADNEPRVWKSDDIDEAPRRAMPPSGEPRDLSDIPMKPERGSLTRQSTGLLASDSPEEKKTGIKMVRLRKSQTFSFDESQESEQDTELRRNSGRAAEKLVMESAAKWGKVAAAHAIGWDAKSYRLFAGDDLGTLRCYNLRDIFLDLNLDLTDIEYYIHSNLGNRPLGLCKKKGRDERSALPPFSQGGGDVYVLGKKADYMAYLGVEFCWALDAHNDRIITCSSAPCGLLTSSADRLVKMWSFEGLPIGTLLQSVPVGQKSRTWELSLDVDSMVAKENDVLDEIIAQVTDLANSEDKPDITTLDFSGMTLGAESADFSKSELRQRIEKTGKLLGLDFPGTNKGRSSGHTGGGGGGHSVDEGASIADVASVSTAKSLVDALKEIKSTESGVDYESKTKQMSWSQQRRKANKLDAISKSFEAKTGVKINITPPMPGSHLHTSDEASEKSVEHSNSIDQLLISLQPEVRSHRDDASVNNDQYSVGSNDNIFKPYPSRKKDAAKSKLAESIKNAHDRGPRTISMVNTCAKFDTFKELDSAMVRRHNQHVSEEQILAMRARRETKHKLFFLPTLQEAGHSNPVSVYGTHLNKMGSASGSKIVEESTLLSTQMSTTADSLTGAMSQSFMSAESN